MKTLQRFLERYRVDPDTGCWVWTGTMSRHGYGSMAVRGRTHTAHRIAYDLFKGPVPPKPMCIDHLCRNRACVNPAHLEVVTYSVNIKRGKALVRPTRCKNGHEFTDADVTKNGSLRCKICKAEYMRQYQMRRKKPPAPRPTHCKRGHPFEGHNLIVKNGGRYCRECKNARDRQYRAAIPFACAGAARPRPCLRA